MTASWSMDSDTEKANVTAAVVAVLSKGMAWQSIGIKTYKL